ncbi:uncharacterized protein LOC133910111 [Phragmites australis]|uniref:uncharacterized protein LOC133910111 n=1 Tax=Phragmites australis TaxID=29695 RepID=UPI002D764C8B|nr:uncharacterized protein LOC133910111 [Phragmites australis]
MGNNNVTGQQVSEDPVQGVGKIIEPSNGSTGLNDTNTEKNTEKDGTQDTNMSKSLKDSIISNGGDEQVASYRNNSSSKIEGLDEKSRGSIQDNASTQDDQSGNLPKEDHELVKDETTETAIYPAEIIFPVSTTIEDMISIKDSSVSSEKVKQIVHGTRDRSGESTVGNFRSLLEENIEGSLEDEEESRSHENAPMGGNLSGEDTNEILQQGHIEVSTVEGQLMQMQGETTSSTESIVSTYLDADDSEIKEVVIEDKPRQKDSPSYVQLLDATNMKTSKDYITEIPQVISAVTTTTIVEPMIVSDEAIEEGENIHGYEDIPEYSAPDNLYNGEFAAKFQPYLRNPSVIKEQEPEKHEINERVVVSRKISDSVTTTVEHSGIERTYMKEDVDKTVAVQNLAYNFEQEKEPEEYDGNLVSPVEVNGKDLTCLHSSSSHHLLTVNDEKEQREVNGVTGILECDKETVKEILEQGNKVSNTEGLGQNIDAQVAAKEGGDLSNLPMTTSSSPLLLLEDFDKGCIKLDISDSNEGTITSTYNARTRDTQETITSSQGDRSQQIQFEEHDVVKLDNGEILSTCMQLVENSSKIGKIFTDGSNHKKVGVNATSISFTIESNQEGSTTTTTAIGFTAECNQAKDTTGVDRATEEQYILQTSTHVKEASEETPLLQRVESICSFSHSTEQHSKVGMGMPMADISVMQFKVEDEEESEKSPLLSPREPSGGDFRVPNHSARNKKPFQSLMTEDGVGMLSPLKEQESIPNNIVLVSSPRSRGKQKTRSSFFTSCMCCATPTN